MKKILATLMIVLMSATLSAQNTNEKHIFSMNAGYAYRFADSHPTLLTNTIDNPDQVNRMKHGLHFGLNYDYKFSKYLSAGLKGSMFLGFHSFEKEVATQNGTTTKLYSDDMNIFYAGPSIKFQLPTIAEKIDLWARGTIGYMNSRITDKSEASVTYSGDCLGYGFDAGIGYLFSKHIGLSFNIEYLGGQVNTFSFGEDEFDISESPENLSRLNFSFGVIIKL